MICMWVSFWYSWSSEIKFLFTIGMLSLGHQHRLGVEATPSFSNALNFSFENEPFSHGISFLNIAPNSHTLSGGVIRIPNKSKFGRTTLKDDENLLQKNESSSTRDIHFQPVIAEPEVETPAAAESFVANFSSSLENFHNAKVESNLTLKEDSNLFTVDPFETPSRPVAVEQVHDDGKVRLDLQCILTETVLISEKSQQVDKFELNGVASGTITNHQSASLLDEPDLHGHLGVSYTIGDPRATIKTLVSGSKAVTTSVTDNAELSQKQVSASIDCKDISAFISKSKAAAHTSSSTSSFAIPAIPIFKYTVADNFRPVVMKTKQIMSIVEGSKIHLIVHVLFNTKVLTGPTLKEASVQVSCSPLGAVSSVDCSTITVASTSKSGGVGKFQASNKVITWSFGELKLKDQPAISMEATIELTTPADASNSAVNASTLPSIYLPMIVKGVSDGLLSNLSVDVTLPDEAATAVTEEEILFPGDAPASSSGIAAANADNNVLIHQIVEFRKQTKLECRFL